MDELFRFMLLRPATPVAPEDSNVLTASFTRPGMSRAEAQRAARAFVNSDAFAKSTDGFKYAAVALKVASKLRSKPVSLSQISALVKNETGDTPAKVVGNAKFSGEDKRLVDSLVAMKLLSDSSGGDAPGLALVEQGYDSIRLAAGERDPVLLRVLSIGDFATDGQGNGPLEGWRPSALTSATPVTPSLPSQLDKAIATLRTLPATGFEPAPAQPGNGGDLVRIDSRLREEANDATSSENGLKRIGHGEGPRPWMMTASAISALPAEVRATISEQGLDLATQPLTVVLDTLHAKSVQQRMTVQQAMMPGPKLIRKFGNALAQISSGDYVGTPSEPLPTGHGNVRPIGIGDLLMVKEHIIRYEGGDLAHVENVLKSEHLSRDTRRLERTETTVLQETETTKEETRDTQTTERFSLNRETEDTIKTDSSFKAGVSVDAKYGPTVEVKANADFATSTATESATKTASEFSKDVVARSTSKLIERVLERRTVTTITEFEEKYSHGFDNTNGSGHINGFYQWLDKVLQAQIYNYGKRLLFDVTVPEPATNFILAQAQPTEGEQELEKPPAFTLNASEITEWNYVLWAKMYDATGLEPPPAPFKTATNAIDASVTQDPHESTKSASLAIDDGYRAKYARFSYDMVYYANARWGVLIGNNWMDVVTSPVFYMDMAGEIGSVAFGYEAYQVENFTATIEIFCERTERAFATWQLKVHAGITQAYQAKLQAYQEALAQARAAAGVVIAGRNPDFNQRVVSNELRKQCLTLVTGQQFDAFGALELSAEGYAQPNLDRSTAQMPYVRFFEEAFEWEHLVYFYYPYFWGWKKGWKNRFMIDDTDPAFGDFLRAGAARVVFPVRPGFEAAIVHYLETGEIWNGGPPPDISGSLYVPIVQEVQEATGAPGNEQPVGDPWEIRLPTTLVRIRPNDDLPTWQKAGEVWQATN
jgi:hypothetical protein